MKRKPVKRNAAKDRIRNYPQSKLVNTAQVEYSNGIAWYDAGPMFRDAQQAREATQSKIKEIPESDFNMAFNFIETAIGQGLYTTDKITITRSVAYVVRRLISLGYQVQKTKLKEKGEFEIVVSWGIQRGQ